ncbi:hypothetical protein [Sphingobium lactosutens]|uniref:Holin n=1 Tax=Sphingobium lactosutens DS20 TaxID=1331060 RepID=T0H8J0_9SPHN|nr:hypothetical protein [Sphingobium lactosutens]EQB12671.1 hypothetical protein RLDS_19375 [Sphingobium lactosutens DS20]MAM38262.1 hypothetical protein [Erythrobacter sp.]|tara:strand:+ start:126 stop:326 length:201 start_codon:yes stop_codon:yes gene_type:complete
MSPEFITAFGQFGPLGLMIAYLVWREKTVADQRTQIDEKRVEADKVLASALTALTVTVQDLKSQIK